MQVVRRARQGAVTACGGPSGKRDCQHDGLPVGLVDVGRMVSIAIASERNQPDPCLAIVIVTRNRQESLLRTLGKLTALEETYPIVVVDNASQDDTLKVVQDHFPQVCLLALDKNYGAVARNFGVELVEQPYVAFADDDSWWTSGSLVHAVELFKTYPRLGLIMSKIVIEPNGRDDPCCLSMGESPLPNHLGLPGAQILGFIACGAVVRRSAFLGMGGFNRHYGTWAEEELLAIDMSRNGWGLSYIEDVISHHHPSKGRENSTMKIQEIRNNLWTYWLRRPPSQLLKFTGKHLKAALTNREAFAGLLAALGGAGWVMRNRYPIPGWLERQMEQKEAERGNC